MASLTVAACSWRSDPAVGSFRRPTACPGLHASPGRLMLLMASLTVMAPFLWWESLFFFHPLTASPGVLFLRDSLRLPSPIIPTTTSLLLGITDISRHFSPPPTQLIGK